MFDPGLLLIALFLPLFPLGVGFNALFARLPNPWARVILLLAWPGIGIMLFHALEPTIPDWFIFWALASALLYAFRLLTMREVGRWTGFFATSVWACLWLPLSYGSAEVLLYSIWFGLPLALLAMLVGSLERRYGAAYTDLYGGLAKAIPRFSGVFVFAILAIVATPVFPTFFTMLDIIIASEASAAISLGILWLLWSWAGTRLIQGMIVGPAGDAGVDDISPQLTLMAIGGLVLLVVAGLVLSGGM